MRKDYDTLEKEASDIVMADIRALHAAKAAVASKPTSSKNAQEKLTTGLLEGRMNDLSIKAEEGDKEAQKTLAKVEGKLVGGSPKRRVKTQTQVAKQKLRIVGKKLKRAVMAGEKDKARDAELIKMGVMPTSQRYGGARQNAEKKILKKDGDK
jgi:hypothetical protein